MKGIVASFIISMNVMAYDKLVCQEYERDTGKTLERTLVIEKTGDTIPGDFKIPEIQYEASKTPYSVDLYKNGSDIFNPTTYNGYVYEEDVNFVFKSEDKDFVFQLYLDEMAEGYLSINNSETIYFFCH